MKKINSKGFTLVELLAVIVIMGILMMVAIPSVTRTIENSRKDTFIDIAKSYANAARTLWTADGLSCGDTNTVSSATDDGDYYILINTKDDAKVNLPVLVDQGGKSSWGNRDVNGFVRVHVETVTDGAGESKRTTTFYVGLSDGTHGVVDTGIASDALKRGNVVMDLTDEQIKATELTTDAGALKNTTEISPANAITATCVES